MKWTQTKPDDYPTTYAEAKAHLRLDDDSEQDYVTDLIAAATAYAENIMGRSLMQRTITATYFAYATPLDLTYLPRGPVISITSVTDANGRDIENSVLEAAGNYSRLRVNNGYSFPVNLTVVYEAGYDSADDIPDDIKHAIKMHVNHLYLYREPVTAGRIEKVPSSLDDFYRLNSWEVGIG